jgi:rhodanese-related sulfurtransferase
VEAYQIMQKEKNYILLDVRTQKEFEEAHIEGAILIPNYEIADKADIKLPSTETLILVYCRTGRRSAESAKKLSSMGYANVYDFGGIADWQYDTVNAQTKNN